MSKWVKYYFVRLKHEVYMYLIKGLHVTQRPLFVHKRPKLWKVLTGDVLPDPIFFFMLTSIARVMCACV